MSKYQKSIIYKIYDNTNGNVYYGSTYNLLRVRIQGHKDDAKIDTRNCASKQIILNGNYSYSMVEPYPCNSKQELRTRERYWIENYDCVNKNVPGRTSQEYYQDNKEIMNLKDRAYYHANKEKIALQSKAYYEENKEAVSKKNIDIYNNNKEEILKRNNEYRLNNIEKINKQRKKYYYENKEQLKKKKATKIVCECGSHICRGDIAVHRRTAKHAKLLALVCPPCPP